MSMGRSGSAYHSVRPHVACVPGLTKCLPKGVLVAADSQAIEDTERTIPLSSPSLRFRAEQLLTWHQEFRLAQSVQDLPYEPARFSYGIASVYGGQIPSLIFVADTSISSQLQHGSNLGTKQIVHRRMDLCPAHRASSRDSNVR